MESKKLEISKEQKQVSSSSVVSKVAGVVKEINEKGVDSNGNSAPFMTILQTGEYRIKGSIDEQNVWMLSEGQEVVIRSRGAERSGKSTRRVRSRGMTTVITAPLRLETRSQRPSIRSMWISTRWTD